MKKILTLFAALLLMGSMMTVQADTYVVAGNNADLFGTPTWAGTKVTNTMSWNGARSLYIKTYTATEAIEGVELKVVKNGSEWKGDFMGNNVKFDISEAGSFDVCFNYQTGVVSVEGANVVPASMYSIYAAGNGSGNWLNGKSWKEGDAANKMTEVEMNVWEITFSNVAVGTGREIKFTNGTWDVNFGGTFSSFGTATNAVSGGDNITFNMSSASDISVRLDLRNCKSDKTGAKFTIANGALPDLHSCVAAGSVADIFGTTWDASAVANKMTWDAVAGKYSKTYTVTKAYKSVSLKTVYDGAWYGDNGENVKFSLSGAGTFTVLFDKNTKEVTVEGAIVGPEQFDFEYVTVSGNGSGNWLHGENWSTNAAANRMTEVATDIYEITFDDVPGTECQFKFSFNGGWDYEIGGVFSAFGTATEAVYGNTAGTITFTPVEDADVTIRLDLSNFNFATKEGASFTVTQILPPPPTVKMNGNFVGASMENTAAFALAANEETASITLTLTAGDYDFKVLSGSSLHSNGYTFHRDYTGATGITGDNTNNMKLEADADGDYTFTWTYETSALSIEFPEEPTPEMVEVKFFAPRDETNKWEHVYAYSFKGSRKFLGEWPGTEITSTKEAGWYTVSVRKGSNLIFTDNAGMQTNDIEDIQAAVCYESTAIDYPTDPTAAKKVTVTANANCEVAYSIAGVKALVGGEADWAEQVSLDANNQIVFPNLVAGTYEFKITNGTWAWALGGNNHLKSGDCSSIASTAGVGNVAFAIDHIQDVTITYYPETEEICLGAETVPTTPIEEIGGKFIINQYGDTAVFSRGNLQYKQSTDTWRCAPNQYDWAGEAANEQMGNPDYAGWVDLFSWSLGAENNYGATSAYLSTAYHNKSFVDWGTKFEGDWATLSSAQWKYLLNSRSGANDKWGMAMIEDNLGMIILPEEWNAPAGITFVPRTNPTSELWDDEDMIDDTYDHFRVKAENMPANKFTLAEWAELEAAGAIFLPYAGRRSGGYGNHTNRLDETIAAEYNYTYYENYLGTYWTSTMSNPAEGKADYVYTLKYQKINNEDDYQWGKAVVWGENGRYGQSVRLVHIIPRQYTVTYTAGDAEGDVPVDDATYLDGAAISLPAATGLSKDGYKFAGWKFKGATYNDTYTVNNVLANEEIVFEAQWELDYTTVRENLNAGEYYTTCLEKAVMTVQGGTIWKVLSKAENGADVILEEVVLPLEAGRPYIFHATADKLEVVYTGAAVGAPVNEAENHGLVGSFTKEPIAQSANNYIIYNNELYEVNSDNVYVGANRAYLDMTGVPDYNGGSAAPGRRRVTMTVHGEQVATGMDSILDSEIRIQKVMIDGQLFILRGEKMFDATGRLVK